MMASTVMKNLMAKKSKKDKMHSNSSSKKISRLIIIPIAVSALFFCSNAFCDGTTAVVPAVQHHHFHDHVNGMPEHHSYPNANGAFEHHSRSNEFISTPQPTTTPFDVSIVQGQGTIRQFGNKTIIKIDTPNAILEGNLSTNSS